MRLPKIYITAALVSLTGCQHFEANQTMHDRERPANATEVASIVNGACDFLADPYSVRDAEISDVVTASTPLGPRSLLCVRANAKNAFGGYTGRQTYAVNLSPSGEAQSATQDMFALGECRKMRHWRRFHELERLRDL